MSTQSTSLRSVSQLTGGTQAAPKADIVLILTKSEKGAGDISRTHVWTMHQPFPIGRPFRWVLEKTSDGIRIRELGFGKKPIEITFEQIRKGIKAQLGDGLSLTLRETTRVASAFDTSHDTDGKLKAFACSGKWILNSFDVDGIFTAKNGETPLFNLRKSGGNVILEPLTQGLTLTSPKGATAFTGATTLTPSELARTSVTAPTLQWRFGKVQTGKLPKPSKEDRRSEEDNRWFRNILASAVFLLGLVVTTAVFVEKTVEEKPKEPETIPAQYAKIIMSPQKSEAPSAMRPQGAQGKAMSSPQKVQNSAMVQAFKAKALQNSMSSLLKGGMTQLLQQSDLVNSARSAKDAGAVFSGPSEKTHSGFQGMAQGRDVKVTQLGGGSDKPGGVGYGDGQKAAVQGQGSAFVDLDTGSATVAKGLTKDEVGRVIHSHLSEVRYCYESAMIRTPDVEGKLVVDFTIGANGVVSTTSVNQSTLPDPRLDDCILRRLASWKFPLPRGGVNVDVTYPFIFKSLGR